MSWVASGWAKKVVICPDGEKIERSEKFLLLILSDYHNEKLNAAWASVTTLATDALMSERHCRSLLRKLEGHKLIETVPGGPGAKGTNSYTFPQLYSGAKIAPPVGQPLPHPKRTGGEIRRPKVGKSGVKGGEIASSPKQEETRREPEEEEGAAASASSSNGKRWEEEDLWLFEYLKTAGMPRGLAREYLMDPEFWRSVGEACGGLSEKFLQEEFASMRVKIGAKKVQAPKTREGWEAFVFDWLKRANQFREEKAIKKKAIV